MHAVIKGTATIAEFKAEKEKTGTAGKDLL